MHYVLQLSATGVLLDHRLLSLCGVMVIGMLLCILMPGIPSMSMLMHAHVLLADILDKRSLDMESSLQAGCAVDPMRAKVIATSCFNWNK